MEIKHPQSSRKPQGELCATSLKTHSTVHLLTQVVSKGLTSTNYIDRWRQSKEREREREKEQRERERMHQKIKKKVGHAHKLMGS